MYIEASKLGQILTLITLDRWELITGEGAALYMWEGVCAVLEGEVITPAVFGADFLSPFAGGGAGGATLCKY